MSIPIERGSLKRQENDREDSRNQIKSVVRIRHTYTITIAPSATCLCEDPMRTTNTTDESSIKYSHNKNITFYTRRNLDIYQQKFLSLHTKCTRWQQRSEGSIFHSGYNEYMRTLLTSHIQFDKLIILDWDDTLFPTYDIPRKQLRAFDCNPLFRGETKQLYYKIKTLIDIIISLFDTITAQKGQIKIVTNAGFGWLSGILNGHFSGVIGRLFEKLANKIHANHVEIISARDEYVYRHSNKVLFDGEIAKRECLKNIFRKYKQNTIPNKVPVIYCIGDGFDEFNACKDAWNIVVGDEYISILQRIKFMEKPSIELLSQELKTVQGLIENDTNTQFVEWILDKTFIIDYV